MTDKLVAALESRARRSLRDARRLNEQLVAHPPRRKVDYADLYGRYTHLVGVAEGLRLALALLQDHDV